MADPQINELAARAALCEAGRRLYQRGLISGSEGNLSLKLPDGGILCTPGGVCKGTLEPAALCRLDADGRPSPPEAPVSTEIRVHLAVYRAAPSAEAVVHAHPAYATAFALARHTVPPGLLPELDVLLGEVPLADYQTPGTQALADAVAAVIRPDTTAVLLANHGALTWAATIGQAVARMEILEQCCRIVALAQALGGPVPLSEAQRAELRAIRRRMHEHGDESQGPDADPGR